MSNQQPQSTASKNPEELGGSTSCSFLNQGIPVAATVLQIKEQTDPFPALLWIPCSQEEQKMIRNAFKVLRSADPPNTQQEGG